MDVLMFLGCFFSSFIGCQIYIPELKLLFKKYNYSVSLSNCITYLSVGVAICLLVYEIGIVFSLVLVVIYIFSFIYAIVKEWILAKLNPNNIYVTLIYQIISIALIECLFYITVDCYSLFSACILGIYYRNNPFGSFCNVYSLSKYVKRNNIFCALNNRNLNLECLNVDSQGLTDNMIRYVVTDYGIFPDKNSDVIEKVQTLIDDIGKKGGGVIFFPKGKYLFNKSDSNSFLQINYSNIILDGEINDKGQPIAELINCSNTLRGEKNPWLSPFFVTTGESIQSSNIFWGLQFKRKKNIITRSGSLADPGSDGSILTPQYATDIISDAQKGSYELKVKDSMKLIGVKYILLGLYNTTDDGNLIKEILGVDELRPEWGTALRAGVERAPSYQWLAEIDSIIDEHTIRLKQPLRRDCEMKYEPALYAVEMLENIVVRNLKLSSKWNGLFRHHGFPLYYSVKQSQEMDYGWNAINMKRVAHGIIENVVIKNFTNPLYVMDSRNITVRNVTIRGYDGHQGIKVYEHACDNIFENIVFYNHYADMLGGEGNAYGNVFRNIHYLNPNFKPVDFDFHGFSEGPMSPPADNLFENIHGFRYIKTAGALYNMPGCAQYNKWKNIISEGEKKGSPLFIALPYVPKSGVFKVISALRHSLVIALQHRKFSFQYIKGVYKARIEEMNYKLISTTEHWIFYKNSILENYVTTSTFPKDKIILLSTCEL